MNTKYPNIEAERARQGMSVLQMMNSIGVKTTKTYTNWRTKGKIPQKKLEALANLFNVPTDYLLGTEQFVIKAVNEETKGNEC